MAIGVWVKLSNGYAILVDREDERLANLRWSAFCKRSKNGNIRVYAKRHVDGTVHRLHWDVIGGKGSGDVDHINGDTLDCRRQNLRHATRRQNTANATNIVGASSRFKGVSLHRQSGKWIAQVVKRHIGIFRDEVDAATAYNFAAFEEFGEYSRGNTA